ncbi:RDD family protein [Halalkalibacter sp. APA_J-10(15)]|uniref:RDD family protein n=1 Tax=Halalkalibacter sp. APA_J-10(15) TaxID=2933805 RepID=UPI001FF4F93D|nr:RDD family protein [Halalkalibacter sp. APA_J-10(15)]MCK0472704.1 RDD family protein [Halalkalibacter sp. APA_J-10(15)]
MAQNPAGFWIRVGASILDGIFLNIVFFVIFLLIPLPGADVVIFNLEDIIIYTQEQSLQDTILGIGNLAYMLVLPVVWFGFTVGKRICGVRIVKLDGSKLGIGAMILRTVVAGVLYVVSIGLLFIISGLMVAFRQDKRSIHDFIAGTYVTRDLPEQIVENE